MADTPAPGTPRYWLTRLYAELAASWPAQDRRDRYYSGRHPLAFATPKYRATFGRLFREWSDNWCPVVVDATAERLAIDGFRFGDEEDSDKDVQTIWQRSYLDADSVLAMHEAVLHGEAAAIVEPPSGGDPFPRITVEHPSQVIVARAAGDRRKRAAALKAWLEDDGFIYATVYLADAVYKFRSSKSIADGLRGVEPASIAWIERPGERHRVPHRFGVVPVVPLRNNPSMLGGGRSDLDPVVPIQNAVNKLATDMLVASEYAAFPQRWATGIEIPTDDDGTPIETDTFLSFIGRVWAVEDENAQFGSFQVSDLRPYIGAIEMLIQHLAAQTRTPPHYLLGQSGAFPSGESLKATETGLVAKVKGRQLHFGEGWEEVVRLALIATGSADARKKAEARDTETIWRDPESRTMGEVTDSALKLKELEVPHKALWERIGASQVEIRRWDAQRQAEALAQEALLYSGATPTSQGLPNETPAPQPNGGGQQSGGAANAR